MDKTLAGTLANQSVALQNQSAALKDANETSKTLALLVSMSGVSSSTAHLVPATPVHSVTPGSGSGNRSRAPATPGRGKPGNSGTHQVPTKPGSSNRSRAPATHQVPATPGSGNRSRTPATSGRGKRGNSGTHHVPATPGSGNRSRTPATPGGLEGHRARIIGDHEHVGREGLVGRSGWVELDAADGQPPLKFQFHKSYLQKIED